MNFSRLLLTLLFWAVLSPILAQNPIGIFIDCQMGCDFRYLKQEIRFVNYMLNRQEADVYILATNQRTGAGGRQVQMVFIGEGRFAELRDTLNYTVGPNATDAIRRDQFVKGIKRGLLPYLLETDLLDDLDYQIAEVEASEEETEDLSTKDPWNYWVFNIGGRGRFEGEQSFTGTELTGRFDADRITDKHKLETSYRYDYEKSTFTLTDGEKIVSLFKRYRARVEYVYSLSSRWSVGFDARIGSSTFGNTDLSAQLRPAIEYNIFPYNEAQTRRFSFNYSIGPIYYDYTDTTLYDKLEETVFRHGLEIEFNQTQKWGNISIDLGAQQYLHNPRLFNAYINPDLEWQIFKGFSIAVGGYVSFVSDRINIAKSDISDVDILLQIKQLDTNFTYFSYVGLNYRFGSSFNNFVNPRF
ncbi:MAG: hypothetical protein AB8H47_03475 [Bacteroidia bacterium]